MLGFSITPRADASYWQLCVCPLVRALVCVCARVWLHGGMEGKTRARAWVRGQLSGICSLLLPGVLGTELKLQGLHTDYLYLLTHLDSLGSCLTPRYVYSAASYEGPQNVCSALMTSHSLGLGHALKVFPTGSSMLDGAYPQGPTLHRAVPHSGPLGKMSRSEKRIIADHKL